MTVGFQFPASFRASFRLRFLFTFETALEDEFLKRQAIARTFPYLQRDRQLGGITKDRSGDKDAIFPVTSSITSRVIEICTISTLLVTVTLAGLAGEVPAVEAAVNRALLFSLCRETRSLPPFAT
jgi:hypothetical protein